MSKNPYSPSTNPFMAGGNLPHPGRGLPVFSGTCQGTSSCHSTNFWPQKRIIFCEVLRCHPTSQNPRGFCLPVWNPPPEKKALFIYIYIYIHPEKSLKSTLAQNYPFFLQLSLWWIGIFQEWSCHHRKWRLIHKGAIWKFHHCDPTLFWDFYSKMTGKPMPWCEFGPFCFHSPWKDFLEFSVPRSQRTVTMGTQSPRIPRSTLLGVHPIVPALEVNALCLAPASSCAPPNLIREATSWKGEAQWSLANLTKPSTYS